MGTIWPDNGHGKKCKLTKHPSWSKYTRMETEARGR